MQQRFNTRNYSIRDFEEWDERDELTLAPKFQRRDVWSDKARSYLIDTIVRGKPIPKIYMRQDVNPKTRRTKREIVGNFTLIECTKHLIISHHVPLLPIVLECPWLICKFRAGPRAREK